MAVAGIVRTGIATRQVGDAAFSISVPDELAAPGRGWQALAEDSAGSNPFFHPGFALPAIECLAEGAISAAVVGSSRGMKALAPFSRSRLGRLAPAIRLYAHKYAPLGEPLVESGETEAALACLVEGLAPEGSGLSLVLPDMPLDGPVAEAVRAVAAVDARPLVLLDEHRRAMVTRQGVDGLRAALSRDKRKQVARQLRRLSDMGPVAFTSDTVASHVRARFEEFLALEAAGWKGRHGTALASTTATSAFSRAAVSNLAEAGKVRIDSLRIGTHPVAILVSFIGGSAAYTWKIAYDEAYARFSPGVQLMLEAPAALFSDPAVMLIDSCASAGHPMIDGLWPERRGIATFVLGPPGGGALFKVGLAAARAELAARANVRQLRDRLA
jgi:CelD/BcsL family acetyltransferase involved in cellulose biosynthesis